MKIATMSGSQKDRGGKLSELVSIVMRKTELLVKIMKTN